MSKICIELDDGRRMNAETDEQAAPLSAKNFVELAKSGFYDGLCFHRVIPAFMIQGGGFTADNGELVPRRASATVRGEFAANGCPNPIKHVPGVLSMARTSDPNSASSQFFVCVETLPYLDGQYAAFGRLTDEESLRVAVDISEVETCKRGYFSDVPVTPVVIKKVTVTEE